MKVEELSRKVDKLRSWYHSISLPCEDGTLVTPGEPYDFTWNMIRKSRWHIDYAGKKVLDLATFDGMWAFEAEQLGASLVVATDCNWESIKRFMLAREVLKSNVYSFFNVPVHELVKRLDSYLIGCNVRWKRHHDLAEPDIVISDTKFDIVQHMGLLYHLPDPMLSLFQARSLIKDRGKLLVETGYWVTQDTELSAMVFNPHPDWRVYNDVTTWWAPTIKCLDEMLIASCFQPMAETREHYEDGKTGRVSLVAEAVPLKDCDPFRVWELQNTYRTPGLEL